MRLTYAKNYLTVLLILVVCSCTKSEERIIPLWPKGEIPNQTNTDTQEVREYANTLHIKNVQVPKMGSFIFGEYTKTVYC